MIKFLVMDVDGTLTDGKIYMGVDGEALKAFDIKDGYALHTLLKEHGIIPVIITARKSPMVEHRCKELGVTEIHQGIMKKLDCLKGIIEKYSSADQQYDLSNVAYIGDDLLDLQCIKPIKGAGGIAGCPSNAVKEVIAVCDFISQYKGGEGAVRDFTDYLVSFNNDNRSHISLEEKCFDAVNYLLKLKGDDLTLGKHVVNDGFFYNVIEYNTTDDVDKLYESHRKYVDIQFLLEGEEVMQVVDIERLCEVVPYDCVRDCTLYSPIDKPASTVLRPNSVLILYPRDGHRTMAFNGKKCKVLKVVGKVRF